MAWHCYLSVEWDTPLGDDGSDTYNVRCREVGTEEWITHPYSPLNWTVCTFFDTSPGRTYLVEVQAVNSDGVSGPWVQAGPYTVEVEVPVVWATTFTDDFNRENGTVGNGWDISAEAPVISNTRCTYSGTGMSRLIRREQLPDIQYMELTLSEYTGDEGLGTGSIFICASRDDPNKRVEVNFCIGSYECTFNDKTEDPRYGYYDSYAVYLENPLAVGDVVRLETNRVKIAGEIYSRFAAFYVNGQHVTDMYDAGLGGIVGFEISTGVSVDDFKCGGESQDSQPA